MLLRRIADILAASAGQARATMQPSGSHIVHATVTPTCVLTSSCNRKVTSLPMRNVGPLGRTDLIEPLKTITSLSDAAPDKIRPAIYA
jgi:hypothetical protein